MWIVRLGLGNGWCYIILLGILSVVLRVWILFLNNVLSGLINLNCIFFGNLLILWCDLIVWVVFVLDLIIFV